MQKLLKRLQTAYPALSFRAGSGFYWSPETREVFYDTPSPTIDDPRDQWALLHETSHALLGHSRYSSDIELLKLEVAAWHQAHELAEQFGLTIDDEHVQNCLDSYRDWLHARALCPTCSTRCLQADGGTSYRCHNCHTNWNVTAARFCRPYRAVQAPADAKRQPANLF